MNILVDLLVTENFIDRCPTLPEEHEPIDIDTEDIDDSDVYNEFLYTPPEYKLELFNSNSE